MTGEEGAGVSYIGPVLLELLGGFNGKLRVAVGNIDAKNVALGLNETKEKSES